jgi:hypothetical protein
MKKLEKPSRNRKNQAKPKQTEPNRFFPKNRTETGLFDPVSVFFKKIRFGYFF